MPTSIPSVRAETSGEGKPSPFRVEKEGGEGVPSPYAVSCVRREERNKKQKRAHLRAHFPYLHVAVVAVVVVVVRRVRSWRWRSLVGHDSEGSEVRMERVKT